MNTYSEAIVSSKPCLPTPADMAALSGRLYGDADAVTRLKQQYRPYICPFHLLVNMVPEDSTLLDIGCGSGLLIGLLASLDKLSAASGFDSDAGAIEIANNMRLSQESKARVSFEYRDAEAQMPDGQFSVVSLIDVLHHVPVYAQESVVAQALTRVAPGGCFIYKDMVARPLWRAWANRFHDLVLAREWINYFNFARVRDIAVEHGFEVTATGSINMLWYGHEWHVFTRPHLQAA
jgi:2-polyprenyl-3-methyl-5-hydroxy-6-metoxy-1,4-benzoquinol methylase